MKVSRALALVLGLLLLVVSCGESAEQIDTAESPPADEVTDGVPVAVDEGAVEVFSWWTAGGEAEGLEALIEVFNDRTRSTSSSTLPWPVVRVPPHGPCWPAAWRPTTRRRRGRDTPAQELIGTYVAARQLEPLNFLFEEEGWLDVLPEAIIPQISEDGDIFSVPVNIHRANVLWYVPEQLEELRRRRARRPGTSSSRSPRSWRPGRDAAGPR
jgi:glucose/mannose transport system substrate-binding protein